MKELSEQERKIKDAIAFLKRRLHLNEAEILESLQQRLAQAEQDARRIPELEMELAMANDAASKGDLARSLAGGMEMEIDELRAQLIALGRSVP